MDGASCSKEKLGREGSGLESRRQQGVFVAMKSTLKLTISTNAAYNSLWSCVRY